MKVETEVVDELPQDGEYQRELTNIFPYIGCPSDQVVDTMSLEEYYVYLEGHLQSFNDHFEDADEDEEDSAWDEAVEALVSLIQVRRPINYTARTVYALIPYLPPGKVAVKFTVDTTITRGLLLYLFTKACQHVCGCEQVDHMNYNGRSTIEVYDDHVVCKFRCDT
jgi:hypothetical protein